MKKQMIGLLILALLILLVNCGGGGGGSSSGGSYKTNVEIVLQTTRSAAVESTVQKETDQIPTGIVTVRFTISAADMDTIRREVQVSGRTSIVETFEVPVGPNRRFLIEAIDSSGNVVYRGQVFANVGGTPITLNITTENTDPVAPVFAGLSNISEITSTSLVLSWSPAADNLTPQSSLQYLIYRSEVRGGQNLIGNPAYVSAAGATSYHVADLSPYKTYYFVVRAKDERGNIDQNLIERTATTLGGTPPPNVPPQFSGLDSIEVTSVTQVILHWSQAQDDVTPSSDIVYLIYKASSPGGQNFSTPTYTSSPGVISYPVNGLTPRTGYYFVVRAKDGQGGIDGNTREVSVQMPFIDLAVENPVVGEVQLEFDIVNNGNFTASNVTWAIENPETVGQYPYTCRSQTISSLPPNARVHFTSTIPSPSSYYAIWVDPFNVFSDINQDNNFYNPPGEFSHFSTILCDCYQICTAPTISTPNYSLFQLNDPNCSYNVPPNPLGSSFTVTFNYTDPEGNGPTDISQAHLHIGWHFLYGTDGSWTDYTWPNSSYTYIGGDGFSGTVTSLQCYFFGSNSSVDLTMTIKDLPGATSNPLTLTINKPEGSN